MFSRLITSLSGIFSPGSKVNRKLGTEDDDMNNGNEIQARESTIKTQEQDPQVAHIFSGLEFSNAETQDRTIHKLHSKIQTSQKRSRSSSRSRVEKTSEPVGPAFATDPKDFQEQGTYNPSSPGTSQHDKLDELQSSTEEKQSVRYHNAMFYLELNSKEASSGLETVFKKPFPELDGLLKGDEEILPEATRNFQGPTRTLSTKTVRETEAGSSGVNLVGSTVSVRSRSKRKSRSSSSLSQPNQPLSTALQTSFADVGDQLFEEAMNDIIEKGGDEFEIKYSAWVWDAFQKHLAKLKSLLLAEFNQKIKMAMDERENELTKLQQHYRKKLGKCDTTTDGFQEMIDNLHMENQKILKAKDFMIEKLKKEFMEYKRHFEQDLARQLQNFRKGAKGEKLNLQKRKDELMKIILADAPKCDQEDALKRKMQSLRKMIKTLPTLNEVLNQQFDEETQSVTVTSQTSVETLKLQLEQTKQELLDLRHRLITTQTEKQDLDVNHHQHIATLHREIQESNARYERQLKDANEEIKSLRKKHAKERMELKQKLINQESLHNKEIKEVKYQYGDKVDSLSKSVSKLQADLTVKAFH